MTRTVVTVANDIPAGNLSNSDGVQIETRPRTRRLSGNVSAPIDRRFSLAGVVDCTMDEGMNDLRVMTGLTYRMR